MPNRLLHFSNTVNSDGIRPVLKQKQEHYSIRLKSLSSKVCIPAVKERSIPVHRKIFKAILWVKRDDYSLIHILFGNYHLVSLLINDPRRPLLTRLTQARMGYHSVVLHQVALIGSEVYIDDYYDHTETLNH